MAGDASEEKTLPASRKKLEDARKKGQVARSRDLVTGVTLAGSLGFLLFAGGGIVTAALAMFTRAGDVADGNFTLGLAAMGRVISDATLRTVAPLLVLVPALVVLANIVMLKGIPFAIDPISPKLDKLNPAEGFKRLLSVKSLIELVKSLCKTVILVAGCVAVLAGGLNALMQVPACGLTCAVASLRGLAAPICEIAAGLFLVTGLADVGLQRWLFLRDQKMSLTEAKRERKDQDGDPHVKRERRRLMHEALRAKPGMTLRAATLVVHDGGQKLVGLRYARGETPIPLVVCRGAGGRGATMLSEAARMGLPLIDDSELLAELFKVQPGQPIPGHVFRLAAMAIARAGAT